MNEKNADYLSFNIKKHLGFLHKFKGNIKFNGKIFTDYIENQELAKPAKSEKEDLRVYDTPKKQSALIIGGVFVKNIGVDFLENTLNIAEGHPLYNALKWIIDNGIVIEIPERINLLIDKQDIQLSDDDKTMIIKHLFAAFMQLYMAKAQANGSPVIGIPYDWLHKRDWYQMGHNKKLTGFMGDYKFEKGYNFDEVKDVLILIRDTFVDQVPVNKILKDRTSNIGYDYLSDFVKNIYSLSLVNDNDATEKAEAFLNGIDIQEISEDELYDAIIRLRSEIMNLAVNRMLSAQERKAYNIDNMINAIGMSYLPKRDGLFLSWGIGDMGTIDYLVYIMKQIKLSLERAEEIEANEIGKSDSKVPKTAREKKQTKIIDDPVIEKAEELRFMNDVFRKIIDALCESYGYDQKINIKYTLNGKIDALAMAYRSEITVNLTSLLWFPSKEIIRSDRPDAAEDFFAKWISGYFGTLVHEVTHIIEGKDDDGTHNKAFSDLQRDIMGRFFQNPQVIKNLTGDLNSLREKYKDLQIRSHKEIVDSVYGEGAYHNEVEIPNETRSMFNKKFTSALLPKNQAKVMMMIEEGEKPLKIAWHVARIEFFESLNPFKFIKDHETKGAKTGAAIVSAVTYLPLLVFGIALAFAPFTLPLAMGLLAGSAALGVSLNLAVHTLVDHFYFFRTQEETQIEKAETAAAVLPDANDGADIGGFIKRYGTRGDTNITPIATNFAIAFASPKMKKYAKELQDLNNKLTESAGKQQQQALKSIIELRKRVMKNKPPISNEDETSFYQSFMLEIDNLIVQNFDLLSDGEKNGSFTGRQRQYFDIMYLANNNSQDELSALANDKSKDIRLRLFAVLQLKKMSYEGDLNEITEEVLETLQSKKIKIENDYDLKAVMTGVHLVLSHSVEDVPDLSKLHDEPSIYDQIAKAVIVNKWKGRGEREGKHRVKAQADEALIFTPDAIDGISVIAHELGHIYLNKLGYVSHGNETMETMHEFFAYVFENLANSLIGGDFLPFSKKLFDFKNEKTVGSHDAAENFLNNINSAFKLLKEKADERFLWKLTAETAAYFATNIFDSADSQSEMFKKFIAVFADKIETQNIGIAKRQVIDAFRISEDDLAGFETGLGKVDTEYGILDKLVENGSLQLTDDNKKTAALFTDAIIEDVLSSMRLSNNEEDVNNMVLGSIKITAKYQRLIDAAYAKLEDIGIKFKNKVPVLLIANDRNCFDLAVTEEYNMIWLSTMNFEGAADEESITKIIAVLLAHENKHIDDHFEDPDKERFKMEKDANDEQHNAMVKLGIESFGPEGSIKADDVRRLAKFFDILSKKQADGSLKAEAGKRASKDPSFYYAENYSKELGLDNLSKKFDIKCNFIAIYDINQSDKERTFWIYGYFEQVSKEDIALINIAYSENGKMVFIEPDEKFLKKILNVLRSLNPLNFVRNKFDALINFAHLIKKGAAKEITYHNAGNSLEKAVSDYGAAYEDENGNVYTNVYFTRELAGENEELLNIGWKINDKNVWIKDDKEQGRVIIYSQAQTEELIENFIKIISSDPKFQGDARTISRIKKASGADLSNVKPGIIIDHNATQNYGTYNKSGSLVVSADIVESENKEERLAKLIKLNGIRNSEAKGILKKLYMDADITKLEDLLEYLKAVYSAEGKYITVDFGIFDGVNDETVKKIVKLAKDNAIFLCAKENDPADTLSRKNYLIRELGFSGYVTVENGKMYRHDPIYSEKHEMGVIERYKSEDEFGKQLESSSKEYNMFKMSEFGQVVNGGNRSITGRVAALEMFKSAILKFYESKMYSPESVKSAGYNFSEPLNAYQAEHENMIHFADAVTQYNVAAAMEALNIDKDSAAYLYLRRIRQNIKDEEQRVLAQLEFLKALSAKALADIALKESGIDDGLANEDFEILLGEKLLERYLTYADTNDIPVEINDFIKSGEGTYNDLNKKIVEQAAKREAQSVNATINLILLSERKAKEIRIEKTQNFNSSAINSILTAA
ncbi:MAG: hypothetical protein LBL00_07715 [Endomicrobium sp.]|nr:hypothetical protein [Endomicrobium sp.]